MSTIWSHAQQINAVPDYVFRNQMSVGRNAVTDTAAYFSIGPRYGANKGFMPPIVGDTATFSSGKRNGLLIFSVQKNKFLYWDSVRVQWSDMAGSSGSYITGSGIIGYLPQFSASTTLDTSALFTLGNRLGIGTSTFAYNSTNTANMELNGAAGGILGFKRNDSARGYLWHTGDNMELANTTAGSIFFNTNSATRGSISSAGVWRLHNLAGTGDRVVVASSNGTLSASTSVTGLVDTLTISTRAWRQKGLDSLAALEVSGSGTTNYVPKFTAASTIGNSQIFDNGTNVGVGTTTAGAKLEVNLASGVNIITARGPEYAQVRHTDGVRTFFTQVYNNVGFMGMESNTPLAIGTNNTERLRITSGGDVGIGTTSPGVKLDIVGSAGTIARIKGGTGSAQGSAYYVQFAGSTSTMSAFGDRANIFGGTVDQIASIYTGSSIPLTFDVNAAERMRITSGGDVGIGTTTPSLYSLGGYKYLTLSNTTSNQYAGIIAAGQGVGGGELLLGNQTVLHGIVGSINGSALAFYTNGANSGTSVSERLRIFANGRVGINTTTDAGYQLDVNGSMRSVNGAQFATTAGNVGIGTTSPQVKLVVSNGGNLGLEIDPTNTSGTVVNMFAYDRVAAVYRTIALNSGGGDVAIGSTSASYKLDINGTLRSVNGANFATTSGNVLIGTATASSVSTARLSILGSGVQDSYIQVMNGAGGGFLMGSLNGTGMQFYTLTGTQGSESVTKRMEINSNGEMLINTSTDAGDYKLQVAGNIYGSGLAVIGNAIINTNSPFVTGANIYTNGQSLALGTQGANLMSFFTNNAERGRINSAGEWIIDASGTDAGDYKLQVVGNARIGTGKLDIASNTTFGLGIARSGTSEVAGQIYNSNGILYLGAESSTGGQIFSGSSAYAAVIGSGANYPLQFATNNATRATINTNGELLINTTTDNGDFKLQVNGNALISGSIKTANGTSSTAVPWHLGSVVATNVQLDTANYVEVEINGVYYRLAIVTPL